MHILAAGFLFPQLGVLLAGGALYLKRQGIAAVRVSRVDRATFAALFREGSKLALYQASFAIACQTDLLLIGVILGAGAGAGFAVAQRVFALPIMLGAALNTALWPVFARADADGHSVWLKSAFLRLCAISVSSLSAIALCLALAYQPLVSLWLGEPFHPDPLLIAGMAFWTAVTIAAHTCDILLRAQGAVGFITKCMFVMMLVNVPLSAELIRLIGPSGAIWGTVVAFAVCLLVPYVVEIRKRLKTGDRLRTTIVEGLSLADGAR
jgi:O-antigen/teichoic acid export membrane protein